MHSDTVGRPMEIMLVEDSLTSARLTMGALRHGQVQHRLTWFTDGEEAMEFLHRRGKFARAPRPDLVLLDLCLPKKDGREVLAEIRADDTIREIPVVIMTASTAEEDIASSQLLQVESYITKPIDMDKFLKLVRELKRFWHSDMLVPLSD